MQQKVVIINTCSYGSTGTIALAQHEALMAQGVQSWFAFAYGSDKGIKNAIVFGSKWGRIGHDRFSALTGLQGHYSKAATDCLIARMKEIQPDLVQLHNLHGNYLHIPKLLQYLAESGCKVVFTLHDCWLFTGKCPHYTLAGCERWKDSCGSCPQLMRYPRSRFFDRTTKLLAEKKQLLSQLDIAAVVAVSGWLAEQAKQSYLGRYPISCIYNGIDTERFCPTPSDLRKQLGLEGKYVILSAANTWSISKGGALFAELLPRLPDDARVVLLGMREEQKKPLPKQILAVNLVKDKTLLAQYYSMADCYISFSAEETFGLTVAEAMACGTPAIVMNSTACPETVDKQTGIVIDRADAAQQAAAAVAALRERGDMAAACRNRALVCFDKRKMQESYLRLYNTVLSAL